MGKTYTQEEAQHIANQIAQVTDLAGNSVFRSVEVGEGPVFYALGLFNDVGSTFVLLRKQAEVSEG